MLNVRSWRESDLTNRANRLRLPHIFADYAPYPSPLAKEAGRSCRPPRLVGPLQVLENTLNDVQGPFDLRDQCADFRV